MVFSVLPAMMSMLYGLAAAAEGTFADLYWSPLKLAKVCTDWSR